MLPEQALVTPLLQAHPSGDHPISPFSQDGLRGYGSRTPIVPSLDIPAETGAYWGYLISKP